MGGRPGSGGGWVQVSGAGVSPQCGVQAVGLAPHGAAKHIAASVQVSSWAPVAGPGLENIARLGSPAPVLSSCSRAAGLVTGLALVRSLSVAPAAVRCHLPSVLPSLLTSRSPSTPGTAISLIMPAVALSLCWPGVILLSCVPGSALRP